MFRATAGAWFGRPILGRGLAVGDLDGRRPARRGRRRPRRAGRRCLRNLSPGGHHPRPRAGRPPRPPGVRGAGSGSRPAGGSRPASLIAGGSYLAVSSRGSGSDGASPPPSPGSRWTGPGERPRSGTGPEPPPRGLLRLRAGDRAAGPDSAHHGPPRQPPKFSTARTRAACRVDRRIGSSDPALHGDLGRHRAGGVHGDGHPGLDPGSSAVRSRGTSRGAMSITSRSAAAD